MKRWKQFAATATRLVLENSLHLSFELSWVMTPQTYLIKMAMGN